MYDVKLIQRPTGRVHQVNNGGVIQMQPILGPDGDPETEYVLAAIVDDHFVALDTYTVGYVEHVVGRPDTALDQLESSSQPAQENAEQAQPGPESPAQASSSSAEGGAQQANG